MEKDHLKSVYKDLVILRFFIDIKMRNLKSKIPRSDSFCEIHNEQLLKYFYNDLIKTCEGKGVLIELLLKPYNGKTKNDCDYNMDTRDIPTSNRKVSFFDLLEEVKLLSEGKKGRFSIKSIDEILTRVREKANCEKELVGELDSIKEELKMGSLKKNEKKNREHRLEPKRNQRNFNIS